MMCSTASKDKRACMCTLDSSVWKISACSQIMSTQNEQAKMILESNVEGQLKAEALDI